MTHKDLDCWKKSIALVTKIYQMTSNFPPEEKFAISAQLKRSAISIPSNIAEGVARGTTKEYIRFLNMATASLIELETQLIIVQNLKLADTNQLIKRDVTDIGKMLYRLKQALRRKN